MPTKTRAILGSLSLSLVLATVTAASDYVDSSCDPYGDPCCEVGCDYGCDGGYCCRPSRWRHLRTWIGGGCCCTTGLFFPHYPYAPECHGYYDFAPYNFVTLQEHVVVGPTLGEPPQNPYARAPFGEVYAMHPNTDYPGEYAVGMVPPLERVEPQLPDLEDTFFGVTEPEPLPPGPEVVPPVDAPPGVPQPE